ncbi:MAG: hypothetical protein ACOX2I_08645 [Candidatus Ozemobacteraceae bacterium]
MQKTRLIILFLFLIFIPHFLFSQQIYLPIYNEWKSNKCNYKPERPFSIIKDLNEFHCFWSESGIDEKEPALDFDRFMVFLWIPGKTLFDFTETQIDRAYLSNDSCIILMNFKKKATATWLKPVIATILPKQTNIDYFIFEKVIDVNKKIEEWKHIYSLWDMSGKRERHFNVAQVENKQTSKSEFVFYESYPVKKEPLQTTTANEPIQNADIIETKPVKNEPLTIIKPTKPTKPTPIPVLMEEDTLFGSEFDITF